jgi:hypothetical protein
VGFNERGCRLVISSGLGVTELLRDGAYVIEDPRSVDETRRALAAAIDAPGEHSALTAAREALDRCHPETWLVSQLESCRTAMSSKSSDR